MPAGLFFFTPPLSSDVPHRPTVPSAGEGGLNEMGTRFDERPGDGRIEGFGVARPDG